MAANIAEAFTPNQRFHVTLRGWQNLRVGGKNGSVIEFLFGTDDRAAIVSQSGGESYHLAATEDSAANVALHGSPLKLSTPGSK